MVSIIVAVAQNNIIGSDNQLIWHISEDLKRFKRITSGHPVIMGRKTYESLGRPLPNRTNVVVSRQKEYSAPGCQVAGSLDEAIAMFTQSEEIFIIGGGEIYRQALPIAEKFYLTRVMHDYSGDTSFPTWDMTQWREVSAERYEKGEKYEYPFEFIDYQRI